jgi:hypothetical protein
MVKGLQACLAAGVQLAFIGREVWVPLNHLCAAFHHPDNDTLAGWASPAQARIPVVIPSNQVFGQADRTLDFQFSVADAKALTGNGSHRTYAGPSKKVSPG